MNANQTMSRRSFMAASGIGALVSPTVVTLAQKPQLLTPRGVKPVVVASGNGNKSKDAAGLTCVVKAFQAVTSGADVLDSLIAGVNIIELDPEDDSVGYGGLPNADGVVQLDASVMHGPTKRAGAVSALEDIATPSLVAKAVMDYTDHVMLTGAGARRFAIEMGFTPQNLLTAKSRQDWLRWRANLNPGDAWLDHP